MSAEILRRAAEAERAEWGDPTSRRVYAKAAAVHLALADWLEEIAFYWPWDDEEPGVVDRDGDPIALAESMDSHALTVARLILGSAS